MNQNPDDDAMAAAMAFALLNQFKTRKLVGWAILIVGLGMGMYFFFGPYHVGAIACSNAADGGKASGGTGLVGLLAQAACEDAASGRKNLGNAFCWGGLVFGGGTISYTQWKFKNVLGLPVGKWWQFH